MSNNERNYTKVRAGKNRQINEQTKNPNFLFLELASVRVCSRIQNPRALHHVRDTKAANRRQLSPMLITKAIIPIRDLTSIYISCHYRTNANHT